MKNIILDDAELDLLLSMYQDELVEAENYIVILKKTLAKLKKERSNKVDPEKPAKKRGRKPSVKPLESKPVEVKPLEAPKKRGRKPKAVKSEVITILESIVKDKKEAKVKAPKVVKAPKAAKVKAVKEVVKAEPKKRGRKPKQTIAPMVQMVDQPVVETPQPVELKKVETKKKEKVKVAKKAPKKKVAKKAKKSAPKKEKVAKASVETEPAV